MVRSARARRSGFTVIELMIALVIIAVMAAAIAPSLSELLADNRQASAAMDIVRLMRRTRAKAIATGYAHLMRFHADDGDADSDFGLGAIFTWAGMNSRCRQTPWAQAIDNHPPEIFGMRDYNPVPLGTDPRLNDTDRHVIAASVHVTQENTDPLPVFFICYQPNGQLWTGATLASLDVQTVPIVFRIRRWIDDGGGRSARGQERQVLLPVGGNARLR